jgi:hypothetical protein
MLPLSASRNTGPFDAIEPIRTSAFGWRKYAPVDDVLLMRPPSVVPLSSVVAQACTTSGLMLLSTARPLPSTPETAPMAPPVVSISIVLPTMIGLLALNAVAELMSPVAER